ncbi:MAG TPA: hypothetical protein VMK53_05885 [Gemmatimonadales bacterium]|nr:hypothetical protein [Gemmatimonadales bacterium]
MMTQGDDRKLDRELDRLRATWRVAPEPPLDAMWDRIEAEAFPPGGRKRETPVHPLRRWLPLAAMLLIGIGVGQVLPRLMPEAGAGGTVPLAQGVEPEPAPPTELTSEPFVGIAAGYLEQVTALLVTLATETEQGRPLDNTRAQARDLLATTRLLLDVPGAFDPATSVLLDDLELVLVQIARLPNRPSDPDVYLIDQALGARDVLPRLRTLLASAHDTRPY